MRTRIDPDRTALASESMIQSLLREQACAADFVIVPQPKPRWGLRIAATIGALAFVGLAFASPWLLDRDDDRAPTYIIYSCPPAPAR